MRSIVTFSVAALCLASSTQALAQQASGPIPVETQVMPFDAPIAGSLTSADNQWGGFIFDCYVFSRSHSGPGIDFVLRNVGDRKVLVSLLDGNVCEVTEDDTSRFLAPGEQVEDGIYGATSLLVGSQMPVSYKLEAHATASGKGCIYRRGTGGLASAAVTYRTLKDNPELVPFVEYEGEWVAMSGLYYPFAHGFEWYDKKGPIQIGSATYKPYGLPRVLGAEEVELFAEKDNVFVGKEKGLADEDVEVVYVKIDRPSCEFQPYQLVVEQAERG